MEKKYSQEACTDDSPVPDPGTLVLKVNLYRQLETVLTYPKVVIIEKKMDTSSAKTRAFTRQFVKTTEEVINDIETDLKSYGKFDQFGNFVLFYCKNCGAVMLSHKQCNEWSKEELDQLRESIENFPQFQRTVQEMYQATQATSQQPQIPQVQVINAENLFQQLAQCVLQTNQQLQQLISIKNGNNQIS